MRRLFRGFSSRNIYIMLALLIVAHIAITLYYAQHNNKNQWNANYHVVMQKIFNAVHLVQTMPDTERERAVAALDDPSLTVSLSATPKWSLQTNELSFWVINDALERHPKNFKISFRLAENQWLNFSANLVTSTLIVQGMLIFMELFVAGVLLFSAWSINRFTMPLKDFKKAADRLGIDAKPQPLVEYGPTIVRQTQLAMNQMQERIQSLLRERTQMLGAISHDLRTPLTRLKLRAQFIKDKEQFDKVMSDLDEMELMLSEALAFARGDVQHEATVHLDLSSLLASICNEFQDLGEDVKFHCEDKRISYDGRRVGLKRCFTNLINNAIKYAGSADVTIKKVKNAIHIIICDNGVGIEESELAKVLEPFYRAEASRSRNTGGTGLGLSVAVEVVRTHGGELLLSNRDGGGLEARVIL